MDGRSSHRESLDRPCRSQVISGLKSKNEVGCGEIAIAVPVPLAEGGIVGDAVFELGHIKLCVRNRSELRSILVDVDLPPFSRAASTQC